METWHWCCCWSQVTWLSTFCVICILLHTGATISLDSHHPGCADLGGKDNDTATDTDPVDRKQSTAPGKMSKGGPSTLGLGNNSIWRTGPAIWCCNLIRPWVRHLCQEEEAISNAVAEQTSRGWILVSSDSLWGAEEHCKPSLGHSGGDNETAVQWWRRQTSEIAGVMEDENCPSEMWRALLPVLFWQLFIYSSAIWFSFGIQCEAMSRKCKSSYLGPRIHVIEPKRNGNVKSLCHWGGCWNNCNLLSAWGLFCTTKCYVLPTCVTWYNWSLQQCHVVVHLEILQKQNPRHVCVLKCSSLKVVLHALWYLTTLYASSTIGSCSVLGFERVYLN